MICRARALGSRNFALTTVGARSTSPVPINRHDAPLLREVIPVRLQLIPGAGLPSHLEHDFIANPDGGTARTSSRPQTPRLGLRVHRIPQARAGYLLTILFAVATLVLPGSVSGQSSTPAGSTRDTAKTKVAIDCGSPSAGDHLPSGAEPDPAAGQARAKWVDVIRNHLNGRCGGNLASVRSIVFGETYTPELADWIVYMPAVGSVVRALTKSDTVLSPPILRGEKFVYVEVFVDGGLNVAYSPIAKREPPRTTGSSATTRLDTVLSTIVRFLSDTLNRQGLTAARTAVLGTKDPTSSSPNRAPPIPDSIRIRREVMQYEVDPFLVRLITGFGSKLFGVSPTLTGASVASDTGLVVPLVDLGPGATDTTHLYFAFAKFSVVDDIWARIDILPPDGQRFSSERGVLANFVTTSSSRFSVSLLGGAVFNARTSTFLADSGRAIMEIDTIKAKAGAVRIDTTLAERRNGSAVAANIYLVAHFHPWRRQPRPLPPPCHIMECPSFFVGTNLVRGSLLDEQIVGVSFDDIERTGANVALGADRLNSQAVDPNTHRISSASIWRFLLGIGFTL